MVVTEWVLWLISGLAFLIIIGYIIFFAIKGNNITIVSTGN